MKICITMGDPAGVGPEILIRLLDKYSPKKFPELVIAGDEGVLELAGEKFGGKKARNWLKQALRLSQIEQAKELSFPLAILNLSSLKEKDFIPPRASRKLGRAMIRYIQAGVELCQKGICSALVTLPVTKESMLKAGSPYPGHTHFLSALDQKPVLMMMVLDRLRVGLLSDHIPLREVPKKIAKNKIISNLKLMNQALKKDFAISSPRIGVLGINPHAGEKGMLGDEEEKKIVPAVKQAKKLGIDARGPLPADTAFYRARKGEFDALLAMYHDQGIAPLKTLDFERVVNVSLGLSFVRTSVGHGTGFDIAWQGKASERSLEEAIKLGLILARNRSR